jgi:hypothetical protein
LRCDVRRRRRFCIDPAPTAASLNCRESPARPPGNGGKLGRGRSHHLGEMTGERDRAP